VTLLRQQLAVAGVFFLNGAVFASWYARVPAIQDDLGLGPGALGVALLGAPIGLLAAQPLVGGLAARRGSRAIVAAAPFFLVAVVLPALATGAATLFIALLVVGAANGALDIAMNAQGFALERAAGRRLFNSLHAAFSFGALTGALGGALAAGAGLDPLEHLAIAAVVGALAAAALTPSLFRDRGDPHAARIARPSRRLAALAAIAFCALLAEGAVFDWSGIYLAREAGAEGELAPAGLAAFSLTMAAGRLTADRTAARLGSAAVARAGALAAAAGLGIAIVSGSPGGGIAGFAVMGLGLSAVFPLSLRAAGEDPERAGPALAAVSTLGYTGFLAGPPAIGLLAELLGLGGALACVCALLALAALLAGHLGERSKAAAEHA
jgi:predicted MFS family arabinose efflux permease